MGAVWWCCAQGLWYVSGAFVPVVVRTTRVQRHVPCLSVEEAKGAASVLPASARGNHGMEVMEEPIGEPMDVELVKSVSWRSELILAACEAAPLAEGESLALPDLWFQPEELADSKYEARLEGYIRPRPSIARRTLPHALPESMASAPQPAAAGAAASGMTGVQSASGLCLERAQLGSAPATYLPRMSTPAPTHPDHKRAFVSEDDLRRERAKRQALTNNRNPRGLTMSERVAALQQQMRPGGPQPGGAAIPGLWHLPYS